MLSNKLVRNYCVCGASKRNCHRSGITTSSSLAHHFEEYKQTNNSLETETINPHTFRLSPHFNPIQQQDDNNYIPASRWNLLYFVIPPFVLHINEQHSMLLFYYIAPLVFFVI